MLLVCHVISKDHVVLWSCDFMDGTHSRYVTILPSFEVKEICYLIWQEHAIKGLYYFIGESTQW